MGTACPGSRGTAVGSFMAGSGEAVDAGLTTAAIVGYFRIAINPSHDCRYCSTILAVK